MDIIIKKNEYGSMFAFNAEFPFSALFQFEFRSPKHGDGWYFWVKGHNNPNIFNTTEFPMEFFINACRAVSFLRLNTPLDADVKIVEGKGLLKKQLHPYSLAQ